jgi:hypothetical protein
MTHIIQICEQIVSKNGETIKYHSKQTLIHYFCDFDRLITNLKQSLKIFSLVDIGVVGTDCLANTGHIRAALRIRRSAALDIRGHSVNTREVVGRTPAAADHIRDKERIPRREGADSRSRSVHTRPVHQHMERLTAGIGDIPEHSRVEIQRKSVGLELPRQPASSLG